MANDPVNNVDPDGGSIGGWIRPFLQALNLVRPATPAIEQFSGVAQATSLSGSTAAGTSGGSAGAGLLNSPGNAAASALGQWVANKLLPMPGGPDAAQLQNMVSNEQQAIPLFYRTSYVAKEDDYFDDPETIIERIVRLARFKINSHDLDFDKAKDNFKKNTDKCNKFVYDLLKEAGADPGTPNGIINKYPPTAEQWANPNYYIQGWRVLGPNENPEPGDVVAEKIHYNNSATGHVGIVSGNGKTLSQISKPEEIVAENNWGSKTVFNPEYKSGYKADVTFRRYSPPQMIKIDSTYQDNTRPKPIQVKTN